MMNSALAVLDERLRAAIAAQGASLTAAIAAQGDAMAAGFARVDRYFELQQQQYLELRDRLDALSERLSRLEHEFLQFRDYVAREITEIRRELRDLRDLRGRPGQTDELRREIAELTMRVERLEGRQSD